MRVDVEVARLMYYDDPILVERREAARLAKLPKKGKSSGLLANLGGIRNASAAWKTLTARLSTPLTHMSRNGTLALTAMTGKLKAKPASVFVCGGAGVPGESAMTMEGETVQSSKTQDRGEDEHEAAA